MKTHNMTLIAGLIAGILVVGTSSFAQPDNRTDPFEEFKDPRRYYKSESKAYLYSNLGLFVPLAGGIIWLSRNDKQSDVDWAGPAILGLSGILVGPSLGYYYGDCPRRGTSGIIVRSVTAALTAGAASLALRSTSDKEFALPGYLTLIIGASPIFFEALYDVSKVGEIVRENNQRRSAHPKAVASLYPAYFAGSGAAGMQLNVAF